MYINAKKCRTLASLVGLFARGYAPCMKKDTSVNVRLTSQQRAALQRLADEDGRELSNYIRRVLEVHLQKDEARKKREMIRKT